MAGAEQVTGDSVQYHLAAAIADEPVVGERNPERLGGGLRVWGLRVYHVSRGRGNGWEICCD